jgi:protein-L-isoaspartate(D-aspartate) O-methyltransferase
MADFAAARRTMVEGQIRTVDVTAPRLLAAFLDVPRERFVPPGSEALAYLDRDVEVAGRGPGRPARYLLKPMTLAKLLQGAAIAESDRVLVIGCGTGYSAALAARLADQVVAVEEDADLAKKAQANLAATGMRPVEVICAPLAAGCPAKAPFEVILIDGAVESLPETLRNQLREGGRLVCVRGVGPGSKVIVYQMDGGTLSARPLFDLAAPLLPGFAAPAEFVF